MTKTQAIIIDMIKHNYRNTEIVQHTGKSPGYVSRVRRMLVENPHYFDDAALERKVRNDDRPKIARVSFAGRVSCLKCDRMFDSEDRRSNRICPKCFWGESRRTIMESCWRGSRGLIPAHVPAP